MIVQAVCATVPFRRTTIKPSKGRSGAPSGASQETFGLLPDFSTSGFPAVGTRETVVRTVATSAFACQAAHAEIPPPAASAITVPPETTAVLAACLTVLPSWRSR